MIALKAQLKKYPPLLRLKKRLDGLLNKENSRDILWVTREVIRYNGRRPFKFVEIGVFKGDNAVSVIGLARSRGVPVAYIGFDLFDDIDDFFAAHPKDRAQYDTNDHTYWEFKSGGHALATVRRKIESMLEPSCVALIKGDSTATVPAHFGELADATMVYIDGCHDYDIVRQDWANIARIIEGNPEVVVLFDDFLYEGVAKVMSEIQSNQDYRVFTLNYNQFVVTSRSCKMAEKFSSPSRLAS